MCSHKLGSLKLLNFLICLTDEKYKSSERQCDRSLGGEAKHVTQRNPGTHGSCLKLNRIKVNYCV